MYLRFNTLLKLFFLIIIVSSSHSYAREETLALQNRILEVFDQNRSAVVRVLARYDNPTPEDADPRPLLSIGTGFFVSRFGYIITNTTVTYDADAIWIEWEDGSGEANVIGHDPLTNVSVLRLKELKQEVPFINLTDIPYQPPVGTLLLSISCEMGLEPTPALGMISGYNCYYDAHPLPTTCIRSDIPSDGGEAGSPVFDLTGRLVGLIIVSVPEIRSSFLLPIAALQRVKDDIIFSGKVDYGFIGIEIDPRSIQQVGQPIKIASIISKSPAEQAGLVTGDVLIEINSLPIRLLSDLRNIIFFARPGQYLDFTIQRGETVLEKSLKVGVLQEVEELKGLLHSI